VGVPGEEGVCLRVARGELPGGDGARRGKWTAGEKHSSRRVLLEFNVLNGGRAGEKNRTGSWERASKRGETVKRLLDSSWGKTSLKTAETDDVGHGETRVFTQKNPDETVVRGVNELPLLWRGGGGKPS